MGYVYKKALTSRSNILYVILTFSVYNSTPIHKRIFRGNVGDYYFLHPKDI